MDGVGSSTSEKIKEAREKKLSVRNLFMLLLHVGYNPVSLFLFFYLLMVSLSSILSSVFTIK
jgi:hypothetical protein